MSSLQPTDSEGKHSCEATGAPLVILVISYDALPAWDETLNLYLFVVQCGSVKVQLCGPLGHQKACHGGTKPCLVKCGRIHLLSSHVLSKFTVRQFVSFIET